MIDTTKVRACMACAKHTQQDVANILNISKVSVNHKLNGKATFSLNEINTIAKLYNKDISFFLK